MRRVNTVNSDCLLYQKQSENKFEINKKDFFFVGVRKNPIA